MAATNIPFVIDLERTTGIELGSLQKFQESVQAFPGFTGMDPTKKAILILQKYITSLSNFGSVSDERQAFFSSNQFLDTFTTQLNKLKPVEAPLTFEQFQSESKDESKSAISLFLDTIFLKSYDKQSHSWRTALAKYLKSSGTLCTTLQPIDVVNVNNTDDPSDVVLEKYRLQLNPALGAVARQNADPSQLINYSFSGGATGFTRRAVCYLCGLPIGRKMANASAKKKNKDETRALNGVGNTNCEHIMPFLSALQSWDFISKAADAPPSIKKKFEMSDEFAWSHFCCNMLKLNIDFLHLDNNGSYIPHDHNIETYLNWLSSNDNRGKYDCLHVLGEFNRDNARASIMERVNRLCTVLNRGNGGKNNYSNAQLIKVYGIFLLLQYVTVADFANIVKLKTRLGVGFGGAQRGGLDPVMRDPVMWDPVMRDPVMRDPVKILGKVDNMRKSRVFNDDNLRKKARDERLKEGRLENPPSPSPSQYLELFEKLKSAFYQTINGLDEASIKQITDFIDSAAANIETGMELLDYDVFKRDVVDTSWGKAGAILTGRTITQVNTILGQGSDITRISLPLGITIADMCKKWFSNMIYDYFNIKLTITDKEQISLELQQELSIPTTEEARSAITQAGQKITNEISNLTLMISPTSRKDGQPMTNALTTLQAMIKNANEVIFIPMLTSLTTNMTPVVTNISVIENIDDIIFYLEQFLVTSKYYTEAKTAAAALATELANPSIGLGSIPDYVIAQMRTITDLPQGVDPVAANIPGLDAFIHGLSGTINAGWEIVKEIRSIKHNEQVRDALNILGQTLFSQPHIDRTLLPTIPFISEALSALPEAIKSGDRDNVFDNVAANIPGLSEFITQLSTRITKRWDILNPHVAQTQSIEDIIEPIERNEQIRDALIKLKELIVGRENLQNLSLNLESFASGATMDIKSLLILPLKIVKTYLTDANTDNVKTAFTQGGGNRIHKRKSGGYRKTIRRNNKRITKGSKYGGGVTYRKKHNKSHRHNTRKHKTRKHKTRRHKMRRHKRSS